MLVSSVQVWLERGALAGTVTREAARLMVLADDWPAGLADVGALEASYEAGIRSVASSCPGDGGCLGVTATRPGESDTAVRVVVSVWMPGLVVPFIGASPGFWASRRHVEVVGPYEVPP